MRYQANILGDRLFQRKHTPIARLVYLAIYHEMANNQGKFLWDADLIHQSFFRDDPDVMVEDALQQMLESKVVYKISIDGQDYGQFRQWETPPRKYQRAYTLDSTGERSYNFDEPPKIHKDVRPENNSSVEPPYTAFVHEWNVRAIAAKPNPLPQVRQATDTRKRNILSRWKERPDFAYWLSVFEAATTTPFCCGQNDRGWVADFDWIIKKDVNGDKVLHWAASTRRSEEVEEDAEMEW